ncbi:MAG: hypothetical protein GWP06_11505 [Actinobacteria bacterium]|nr:hypothetical protein [Actinomycetota bacterium]
MKNFKSIFLGLFVITFSLFFVLIINTNAFSVDTCVDCHKDKKFRVQDKKVFDYFNKWKGSVHDIAGVTCVDCHGGDPSKAKKEQAHPKNLSPADASSMVYYKNIPETCGKCHEAVYVNFVKSDHYKVLKETGRGPVCTTCHGSLVTNVYYTSIVLSTCISCHNQQNQNHPEVINTAEQILHRLNVSQGYMKWTSIHYKKKSGELIKLNSLYQKIANSWHQFNFATTEKDSNKLLSEVKALFHEAYKGKKK